MTSRRQNIPQHLVRPAVEKAPIVSTIKPKTEKSARPLSLREKREEAERIKKEQIEHKRKTKWNHYMSNFMNSIKESLIANKMEDEPISGEMIRITVADAKEMIKEKRFIQAIYRELFNSE
jgi:hypothetical protein